MLFNKGDRVVHKGTGKAGKVSKASATRDAFDVTCDDGGELEDLRGAELLPEHKVKGTPAPR